MSEKSEIRFWENEYGKKLERGQPREVWNLIATEYYNEKLGKIVNLFFPSPKNKRVLEAGSGSGMASINLGRKGSKIYLLDNNRFALEYSKKIANFYKVICKFYNGSLFSIPFKKNMFDFVWNVGVVEHYSRNNILKILKEMKRVTKMGGKVAVGIPNPRSISIRITTGLNLWRGTEKDYDALDIEILMGRIGLSNLKIFYVPDLTTDFDYPRAFGPIIKILLLILRPIEVLFKKYGFVIIIVGDKQN